MSLPTPYYQDDSVTLYHGDCREIVPLLDPVDVVVTDPPYGETALKWDTWPDGWPTLIERITNNLWCFGSMRMFLARAAEFANWTFAQDLIWEKQNGTGAHADRFRRVHECALQFYRGAWGTLHKAPVMTLDATRRTVRSSKKPTHWDAIGENRYVSEDGGPRLMRSVIYCRNCWPNAVHPTQKPEGIIRPILEYSLPAAGTVLDLFAGSGTVLIVARELGRKAIGIESDEVYCEAIARRMGQEVLAL